MDEQRLYRVVDRLSKKVDELNGQLADEIEEIANLKGKVSILTKVTISLWFPFIIMLIINLM